MRVLLSAYWLVALLAGCRSSSHTQAEPGPSRPAAHPAPPVVVREATVVAFWLPASDTLGASDGADLLDDFRYYTRAAAPWFDERGIALVTTNSDTIVVEAEGAPRRVIMLTGLDYPFGYVLVEPGYAEEILTGVVTDEDLLDEADAYFGSDEAADEDGSQRAVRPPGSRGSEHLAHLVEQGRG